MRLKGIIGFIVEMLLFMPYSYAFSWHEHGRAACDMGKRARMAC